MFKEDSGRVTAEQVSHGHTDKIADQISDSLVDRFMVQDPGSRLAIETAIKNDTVMVFGEVKSTADVDVKGEVARVLGAIDPSYQNFRLINELHEQSPDIALGTDDAVGGAGDQGIMVGLAVNSPETNYLPRAYWLATQLAYRVAHHPEFGPDVKTQVTLDNGHLHTVLVAAQHDEAQGIEDVRAGVREEIDDVLGILGLSADKYLINPTGRFTIGGSWGDAGLTGRKIIADTYGSIGRHGGGAFSGKDPSKVDRSAAYMTRAVAKKIVRELGVDWAEVRIAYAIGEPQPIEVTVNSSGTIHDQVRATQIAGGYDWTPRGIDELLGLRKYASYGTTATYGHFTDINAPWEKTL